MMDFITIDGVALPTPDSCTITEYDMDSAETGRSESAYLQRERIRSDIAKIDLSWDRLTVSAAQTIRAALSPASFAVVFHFHGSDRTETMYAGDRTWSMQMVGQDEFWTLSVALTAF